MEYGNFSIEMLTGDSNKTDGEKIYDAIRDNLNRARVSSDVKRDQLLNQFSVIKGTTKINQIEPNLEKTPNKHYTKFLYKSIYQSIRYHKSGEDYLGRFYGEFMSYSGGDGQALGIILTPRHITELFRDLLDLKPSDTVMDPCCGFRVIIMITANIHEESRFSKSSIKYFCILRIILFASLPL